MATIRRGKPEDALDFILVMKQFLKEAKYTFRVDAKYTQDNFETIAQDENYIVLLVEEEEEIVGFLVGVIGSTLFSKDLIAIELGWYLLPEHRNAKTGLKLVDAFEKWSQNKNCKHVSMVDIDTLKDLKPLYERRGYVLTEKTYVKEL